MIWDTDDWDSEYEYAYMEALFEEELAEHKLKHIIWHNNLLKELIMELYNQDRYDRMVSKYGEIWADIHLPY